jgi:hypothetical protein
VKPENLPKGKVLSKIEDFGKKNTFTWSLSNHVAHRSIKRVVNVVTIS